jgi:Stage II sporulation protein E (SpoIIE)
MVATTSMDRSAATRRAAPRRRSAVGFWFRHSLIPSEAFALPALVAIAFGVGLLARMHTEWVQTSMVTLPLLLGGFLLRFTAQLVLLLAAALVVVGDSLTSHPARPAPGVILLVGATALIVLIMSRERVRLGVRGTRGESMLFDLRERLQAQGKVPRLADGWHIEHALKSAGGQSFAGDFLIAAKSGPQASFIDGAAWDLPDEADDYLQLGLVDVSGKGLQAGTRALLLSGAFGGLLGSVPAGEFLAAANRYLLRQDWDEGFATAVHLLVNLTTGEYECYSAGHPPIAQLAAGSGKWSLLDAAGPALGILDDVAYRPTTGRLAPGDALMLYTDGLIELPGRDLSIGQDRLLGAAGTLQTKGFEGGADRVVDAVARNINDDRALVLLWRD